MKFPRPLVYVFGPFRGDVEINRARARQAAREVYRRGGWPVVPHNLSIGLEDMMTEAEWMEYDLAVMGHCPVLAGYQEGLEDSTGSMREVKAARLSGKPIWWLDEEAGK